MVRLSRRTTLCKAIAGGFVIRSVLGFGELLTSGDLFAVILFSKVAVPPSTASLFKWTSFHARIAVDTVDPKTTFVGQ